MTDQSKMFFGDSTEKQDDSKLETPKVSGSIIDLPTAGAAGYPSYITHRELLMKDEEKLKTATADTYSRTVNAVLKSICNDAEFFDDMLTDDRDFVIAHIWGNTYQTKKEFEATCQHCGHKEKTIVDIFAMDTIYPKENWTPSFKFKVNKTGDEITYHLTTVATENAAEKFMAAVKSDDEYTLEAVQIAANVSFNRPMSIKDKVDYLKENLNVRENRLIHKFAEARKFGIDSTHKHTCSECQGVTHGEIPFQPEDIIYPDVSGDFDDLLRDIEGSQDSPDTDG